MYFSAQQHPSQLPLCWRYRDHIVALGYMYPKMWSVNKMGKSHAIYQGSKYESEASWDKDHFPIKANSAEESLAMGEEAGLSHQDRNMPLWPSNLSKQQRSWLVSWGLAPTSPQVFGLSTGHCTHGLLRRFPVLCPHLTARSQHQERLCWHDSLKITNQQAHYTDQSCTPSPNSWPVKVCWTPNTAAQLSKLQWCSKQGLLQAASCPGSYQKGKALALP